LDHTPYALSRHPRFRLLSIALASSVLKDFYQLYFLTLYTTWESNPTQTSYQDAVSIPANLLCISADRSSSDDQLRLSGIEPEREYPHRESNSTSLLKRQLDRHYLLEVCVHL